MEIQHKAIKSSQVLSQEEKTAHNKEVLLVNLEKYRGLVATACQKSNISRATYYLWFNNDKDFRSKCEDIIERQVDIVEAALFSKISEKDTASIIFYLKTKGKNRGYVERVEVDGKVMNVDAAQEALDRMTQSERDALLRLADNLDKGQ